MAFLKFNKAELVNLSYSLKREILLAGKTGTFCNTSIVSCNTRRYHSLLTVPLEQFGGANYNLLSCIDESLLSGGKRFNLGIHRYGDLYDPRGHKYIIDFQMNPIPEIVYKVGDVVLSKSFLIARDEDEVLLRYELRNAPRPVTLILRPFLAFRDSHALTHKNDAADLSFEAIPNGASFCLYAGFPRLNIQLNTVRGVYDHNPVWYEGITYSDEARRGFECREDLLSPGVFSVELKQGQSIILSASLKKENPVRLRRTFDHLVSQAKKVENEHDMLEYQADILKRGRNGKMQVTSGFSWLYTGLLRETLYALPGLTLYADGNAQEFEDILDNLIEAEGERLFRRTTQIDAPLRLADVLQQYIAFGADERQVWKKYGTVVKGVIESYGPGRRKEVSLQPDGLLWAQMDGVALTWMNAYIDGRPVTERAGYQVETNAFWYNSLCFAIEMERKYNTPRSSFIKQWAPIRDLAGDNFQPMFWNESLGCLADYVDANGQNMDVRPNQLYAVWVPYSPVDDFVAGSVINIIERELLTRRGIRTLSPRDVKYRGVYEGSQTERDLAYHQGCARPFLLLPYTVVCLRMRGAAFLSKAKWLTEGFYEDLGKHGVGAFSELYDGDPPHEPHGAVSSALSTAALLGIDYYSRLYEEGKR